MNKQKNDEKKFIGNIVVKQIKIYWGEIEEIEVDDL